MEELIIRRSSTRQYIFYPNLIIAKKKDKVIHEIELMDIERITYHPKFRISDMFVIFTYSPYNYQNFPKAFVIIQKEKSQKL